LRTKGGNFETIKNLNLKTTQLVLENERLNSQLLERTREIETLRLSRDNGQAVENQAEIEQYKKQLVDREKKSIN